MTQFYSLQKQDPFQFLPLTFHIEQGETDPEFLRFTLTFNQIEAERVVKQKMQDKKRKELGMDDGYYSEEEAEEEDWQDEQELYGVHVPRNVWIMKPGENSNQGNGIVVVSKMSQILKEIQSSAKKNHTHIIQKYIERPLLIQGRKFDLRVFGLFTSVNGCTKGYYFDEGYMRTSSYKFTLDNLQDRAIHLTNDAIQKNDEEYCKYENGNKMSY